FLRGIFLRGRDTISNRSFLKFVKFCKQKENNYYLDSFPPTGNLLPDGIGHYLAKQIEEVMQQLRNRYRSGRDFVRDIERITKQYDLDKPHVLYIDLISKFTMYKRIGCKIANAIMGEFPWELSLLKMGDYSTFVRLKEHESVEKLALAGLFNVMIDTHLRSFFKDDGIEKIDNETIHTALLVFSKDLEQEVVEILFDQKFDWVENKNEIIRKYHNYIGANLLEKLIWSVYFVKKNVSRRNREEIYKLRIFHLMEGIL
ncbi:MAG: hypothetical protein DRN03_06420, partial [Thermoplasmata archaeon]